MTTPISPIVAEAAVLRPDLFPSLLVPPSGILQTNARPFAIRRSVKSGAVLTFKLLEDADLKRQIAGFLSAKIVGPLRVTVVGAFVSAPSLIAGAVVIALHDSTWEVTTLERAQQVPDSLVMGLGMQSPAATGVLALPAAFKNNAAVAMPAGLTPAITVAPTLFGYDSVAVVLSGLVELEGMVPLQPWA